MLEFAERIIGFTGSRYRIVFMHLPQDDPKQHQPDISLAGERLGWKPIVDREEGLRKTIGYFRGCV